VYWKPPKQARVNASDSYRSRSLQKAGNNTVVLLQNVVNGDYNRLGLKTRFVLYLFLKV
jgi:hypothetical protein